MARMSGECSNLLQVLFQNEALNVATIFGHPITLPRVLQLFYLMISFVGYTVTTLGDAGVAGGNNGLANLRNSTSIKP